MNRKNGCVAGLLLLGAVLGTGRLAQAQTNSPQAKLSVHWEELTGPDFLEAIQRSQGTCLLPFGILEKHGPHMPIGSDLLNARYAALHAAEQQYAVVFPEYYFGQISEARHEPGTATSESGADQHRLNLPEGVYTGIWWYARFPDHYAGEGSAATRELGDYQMKWWVDSVSKVIVDIKADDVSLKLQNEFYEKSAHPLDTPQ